jgi:AI-2 transport protein TqsA
MTISSSNRGNPPAGVSDRRLGQGLAVIGMSLLILVLSYLILRELAQIFRPLLVAVFVCYLIVPAHRWLVRHRLPSAVSYVVIVGGFFLMLYGVGNMAFRSVSELSAELPGYMHDLERYTQDTLKEWKARFAAVLPEKVGGGDPAAADDTSGDGAEAVSPAERPAPTGVEPASAPAVAATEPAETPWRLFSAAQLTQMGRSTLQTFIGSFAAALVIVIYLIFLLAETASFDRRVIGALGEDRGAQVLEVVGKINVAVAKYIAVKTFVSLLIAVISAVILLLFGVKYALMWGVITFFFNFIPYIGSLVAVALPIAMSFVQFNHDPWKPIMILVLLVVAQQLVGSVLEPRLVGKKLGVSPLIILLSLAFWGMLWGVPGMILSAPLAVSIKIVLENIQPTRPIARLCSSM